MKLKLKYTANIRTDLRNLVKELERQAKPVHEPVVSLATLRMLLGLEPEERILKLVGKSETQFSRDLTTALRKGKLNDMSTTAIMAKFEMPFAVVDRHLRKREARRFKNQKGEVLFSYLGKMSERYWSFCPEALLNDPREALDETKPEQRLCQVPQGESTAET